MYRHLHHTEIARGFVFIVVEERFTGMVTLRVAKQSFPTQDAMLTDNVYVWQYDTGFLKGSMLISLAE